MEGTIYSEIFIRLAWVVGLLATVSVLSVFLYLLFYSLRELWWLVGPLGALSSWYLQNYHASGAPILHGLFWASIGFAALGALCGLQKLYLNVRERRSNYQDHMYADGEIFSDSKIGQSTYFDPVERVLELERARKAFGFKPGWLYFQCEDDPVLLRTYILLQESGRISCSESNSQKQERNGHTNDSNTNSSRNESQKFDPYLVLEVAKNATQEQIQVAYRTQMKLYHPDRVDHLGSDLKALALERAKQIQRAYEMLRIG